MANWKVIYAYHVTDVLAEDYFPPKWRHLETTMAANKDFDGPLVQRNLRGVFLNTTLRDYDLPTRTVYPTHGRSRESYWRVCVPLTRFNNKRIFKIREDDNCKPMKQVLLLLADNSYSHLIYDILDYSGAEELTNDNENHYLYREEVTKTWYTNNLDYKDPYWVNIFIPHRVRLGPDCVWDIVQHY